MISQPFIVQIMTSELTCSSYNIAVLTPESPKFEAPWQGKITSQLYRVPLLPHIDQVILSPAIWRIQIITRGFYCPLHLVQLTDI